MSKNLRRSVFVLAAEMQYESCTDPKKYHDRFSCYNVEDAAKALGVYDFNRYKKYYARYFKPRDENEHLVWWWRLEGGAWDHESRILALLLCAEMLRR